MGAPLMGGRFAGFFGEIPRKSDKMRFDTVGRYSIFYACMVQIKDPWPKARVTYHFL